MGRRETIAREGRRFVEQIKRQERRRHHQLIVQEVDSLLCASAFFCRRRGQHQYYRPFKFVSFGRFVVGLFKQAMISRTTPSPGDAKKNSQHRGGCPIVSSRHAPIPRISSIHIILRSMHVPNAIYCCCCNSEGKTRH